MSRDRSARQFFLLLMIVACGLLLLVIVPLASALFLAAVLSAVFFPLHRRLTKQLRNHRNLSAGFLVFSVVVLLLGPLAGFSAFMVKEATEGVKYLQETIENDGITGLVDRLPSPLQKVGHAALESLPTDPAELNRAVTKQVQAQGGKAAGAIGAALSATGSFVLQGAMMLIAFFFLLVDGEAFVAWLDSISPLKPGQTRELLGEFRKVSYAVVVSSVATAAAQSTAALAGYLIASLPRPFFLAAITFFVALIPAVGAASVCVVAALFLLLTGHPYMAIFLAAWGVLVVGLVDNVVKPLLMKGGMELHGAIVFFSLLGGLAVFGPIGLIAGPLVVAFFMALIRMYQRDFAPQDAHD